MAPAYKLTYFELTGLGEPIRFLFKYGNIDFEDNRIPKDDWPAYKPKTPFGQLPILEHNGRVAPQGAAIARYVGKLVKLAGKDDWENLEIDSTADTIIDVRTKIAQYKFEGDAEKKEKMKDTLFKETLPFYLERLDAQVKKNNGYFVGGRLTWVDVFFVAVFDHLINEFLENNNILAKHKNLTKLSQTVLAIPAIKTWIETRPENKF